jgi:hypothetical protein
LAKIPSKKRSATTAEQKTKARFGNTEPKSKLDTPGNGKFSGLDYPREVGNLKLRQGHRLKLGSWPFHDLDVEFTDLDDTRPEMLTGDELPLDAHTEPSLSTPLSTPKRTREASPPLERCTKFLKTAAGPTWSSPAAMVYARCLSSTAVI